MPGACRSRRSPSSVTSCPPCAPGAATVFEVYADAVDDSGRRVWISTAVTLEAAVAWMREHDMELLSFAGEHTRRRRELATGMMPTHY